MFVLRNSPTMLTVFLAAFVPLVSSAAESDQDRIQGKWQVASVTVNGKKSPGKQGDQRIFRKNELTVVRADKVQGIYRFSLQSKKSPNQIDFSLHVKGVKLLTIGIYKIDGDMLTVCLDSSNKSRPTTFTSKKGDGHLLSVMKRVKQ